MIYSDGSREFISTIHELRLPHEVARPHRTQTNGVAERAVRRVLDGSRSILHQSGLLPTFGSEAVSCDVFLRNICDKDTLGPTAYEQRFG